MSTQIIHSKAFRYRRFLNWFPMGLSYALLYMGRYNLTVAKNNLGSLMTKEDFGFIFGLGAIVYGFAFLLNGPLVDKLGGRKGMLISTCGAGLMNLVMGLYLFTALSGEATSEQIRIMFSVLYGANMYFQSFGAVSIVKVNAHWFHINERGGFSGIFGTMISSGIFLAFTVNGWLLQLSFLPENSQWIVFFVPAFLLIIFCGIEFVLLKDQPSHAGFDDFDTGDASSGEENDKPMPVFQLYKRIFTNPIIMTVAMIEFCTGVLRNGIMHWFPFYLKEVWAIQGSHPLRYGEWTMKWLVGLAFVVAIISFIFARRTQSHSKAYLYIFGALAFLAPFVQGGWGGLLFVAGVIGGNIAGWVSDIFFQSRRAPAAGGLYGLLAISVILMIFTIRPATTTIDWSQADSGLQQGDVILEIAGVSDLEDWNDVVRAVQCIPATCERNSTWDTKRCICTTKPQETSDTLVVSTGTIQTVVERNGQRLNIQIKDPSPTMSGGDQRRLKAGPQIPISPFLLGIIAFIISLCVIGAHGLLSGTATMDFGGRRGAATAVGVIDGFVYLGTGLQAFALGKLTTMDWSYWPLFMIPFALLGFVLLIRIWHAKPKAGGAH